MDIKILRLVGLAFALITIDGALGPWLLFRPPSGGLAVHVYLVAGFCSLFFGLVQHQLTLDPSREMVEQLMIGVAQRRQKDVPLRQQRTQLYSALFLAMRVTCWPAFEFGLHNFRIMGMAGRLRGNLAKLAALNLHPFETSLSFFLFLLPLALTAYAALSSPPFVFSIDFLWMMVFTLFLKHSSYLIGAYTVLQRLRRSLDSPLVSYLLIAACDFAALVLCYHGIVNWNTGTVFEPATITVIITRLFALKDFLAVFEHPPQRIIDYCIGVSGLLWWFTLAQGLLHLKDYARSPFDYLCLASDCMRIGLDTRARTALDAAQVSDKLDVTEVSEKLFYEATGQIYAALGDFDKAAFYVQRYLRQADEVPLPPSPNYIFLELQGGIISLRPTSEMFCKLIEYGDGHGLSDVYLSNSALVIAEFGIAVLPVARFVEQRGLVDHYPLAYAALMWRLDEERDVLDRFDAGEPKERDARRAVWLCLAPLLWPARRKSESETAAFIEQWLRSGLIEIQQIAITLADQIEKFVLIDMLTTAQNYLAQFDVNLLSVPAVIAAIDASFRDDEVIRKIRIARTQQLSQLAPPTAVITPAPLAAT